MPPDPNFNSSMVALCLQIGRGCLELARLEDAEKALLTAQRSGTPALGEDHELMINALDLLGNVYFEQGELDKSEQTLGRALTVKQAKYGSKHFVSLIALNNLGDANVEAGHLDLAERHYQQALCGLQDLLDGSQRAHASRLARSLGALYQTQAKMQQAEDMFKLARQIAEAEAPVGDDLRFDATSSLGEFYIAQRRFQDAQDTYEDGLRGHNEMMPPDVYNNLAVSYLALGKLPEAETMAQKSVRVHCEIYGEKYLQTSQAYFTLGSVYNKQGRTEDADDAYEKTGFTRLPGGKFILPQGIDSDDVLDMP
ncbi:hypothetical protein ANO11243_085200 [Dothideomycetidae sp. 11243]|nr:hypothetical protein ANO11243_085200 [fungal sp. No.11243]